MIARALALAVLVLCPAGANACRLALVLALDVSTSVDAAEDQLQRAGVAAALVAPEVRQAFFASNDPVALAVYEWSGRYNQHPILDWRLIVDEATLVEVAAIIGRSERSQNAFPTAMGYALGHGAGLLDRGPECLFKTLDMAGDGENNEGFQPSAAYAEFPFQNVTVNGLVVSSEGTDETVIAYYRDEVLYGPGAFLEIARGFEDYERAMRRKLERELELPSLGALPRERGAPKG